MSKVYYRGIRDIGKTFTDAFSFIRENFKPFFAGLLLFAGPFLLAASALSTYYFGGGILKQPGWLSGSATGSMWFILAILLFVSMIGMTVYTVVMNRYLVLNEQMPPGQRPEVRQVADGFFADFWRVLGNMVLFWLLLFLCVMVLALVIVALISLTGLAAPFFIILAGVGMMLVFPVLTFLPVGAFFLVQRDDVSVFVALGNLFRYMRGKFWNTWVISFLAALVYMFLSFVAQLPAFIVSAVSAYSRVQAGSFEGPSLTVVIISSVCAVLAYMVATVYYLVCIFHFAGLEERTEGTRLSERINQIV